MSKDKGKEAVGLSEIGLGLEELIRRGARRVIQEAIEVELAELLEQFSNVKILSGQRAVVRASSARAASTWRSTSSAWPRLLCARGSSSDSSRARRKARMALLNLP